MRLSEPVESVRVVREGQNVWIEAQSSVGTLYLRQDTDGHLYVRLMGPKLETEAFDERLKLMSAECANELSRALQDETIVGVHGAYMCREFVNACAAKRMRLVHASQRTIETYLHSPSCDERDSIVALVCFALEKATLSHRENKQRT